MDTLSVFPRPLERSVLALVTSLKEQPEEQPGCAPPTVGSRSFINPRFPRVSLAFPRRPALSDVESRSREIAANHVSTDNRIVVAD